MALFVALVADSVLEAALAAFVLFATSFALSLQEIGHHELDRSVLLLLLLLWLSLPGCLLAARAFVLGLAGLACLGWDVCVTSCLILLSHDFELYDA